MRSKAWLPSVALTFIALVLLSSAALAAPPSPFVGHWQTIDTDGSDIRLTIAGRGPYQVTWTESFFSFCNREAGIARGTAAISANPNVLEGDLFLQCFTVEKSTFFRLSGHTIQARTRCPPLTGKVVLPSGIVPGAEQEQRTSALTKGSR